MQRSGSRDPDADNINMASTSSHVTSTQPDLATLYNTLNEYLVLENKYQPRLCLPNDSENGEVTTGARDGAAHVMRCLKVWFDLPVEVLIEAINLFDRFLTKMKVRPCHVPCITVACMNIAIEDLAVREARPRLVSVEELVSISQSACTAGDVCRMSRVVVDKLGLRGGGGAVTALRWLTLLGALMPHTLLKESELTNLLEIVACDHTCANIRSSELALVILFTALEQRMVSWSAAGQPPPDDVYGLFDAGAQIQQHCRMSDASLVNCRTLVRAVLERYGQRRGAHQRQRLVWRLSTRTMKVLRPTDRLTSLLPTIEEQHHLAAPDTSPNRNRSGSESSESEETSDWPRSPVLPVYCDN